MILVALSGSQTLTLAVVLLCLGGLAMILFAYYSYVRSKDTQEQIKQAVATVTNQVGATSDKGEAAPPFGEAAAYVRALGELAEKLGKVSPPVAALIISTLPFLFASALVAIDIFH